MKREGMVTASTVKRIRFDRRHYKRWEVTCWVARCRSCGFVMQAESFSSVSAEHQLNKEITKHRACHLANRSFGPVETTFIHLKW